jgi:predicted ATPase
LLSALADAEKLCAIFVDLSPLNEAGSVEAAISSALQIKSDAGIGAIENWIADRAVVLALDNCEHVLASCSRVAEALLRSCPKLKIVTTTRIPLKLVGEVKYPVRGLDLPEEDGSMESGEGSGSVRLFVERATEAQPGFRLDAGNFLTVCEICRKLDGLPLGIELAAALVRWLPLKAISQRLASSFQVLDSSEGAGSLSAILDCTYEQLPADGQELLKAISVFKGGASYDSIGAIWQEQGANGPPPLAALADRCLISLDALSQRYVMLETVREYCRSRLNSRELGALQGFHANHFGRRASELCAASPNTLYETLDEFEFDKDNYRQAHDHWLANDPEQSAALALSLWRFWVMRGYLREAAGRLTDTLAALPEESPLRGTTRAALAYAAYWGADVQTAATQSSTLLNGFSDDWSFAVAYIVFGALCYHRRDVDAFLIRLPEVLEAAARCQDVWLLAVLRYEEAGLKSLLEPDFAALEQAAAELHATGDLWFAAHALVLLARNEMFAGSLESCRRHLSQAMSMALDIRSLQCMVWVLEGYAHFLASTQPGRAIEILVCADNARSRRSFQPLEEDYVLEVWQTARAALSEAEFEEARLRGVGISPETMGLDLISEKALQM